VEELAEITGKPDESTAKEVSLQCERPQLPPLHWTTGLSSLLFVITAIIHHACQRLSHVR
jgi:hypothetical protein